MGPPNKASIGIVNVYRHISTFSSAKLSRHFRAMFPLLRFVPRTHSGILSSHQISTCLKPEYYSLPLPQTNSCSISCCDVASANLPPFAGSTPDQGQERPGPQLARPRENFEAIVSFWPWKLFGCETLTIEKERQLLLLVLF